MGWGRMFLLGNFGQQLDIEDLSGDLATLESQVDYDRRDLESALERVQRLEHEVAELRLYLATTMRLLQDKRVLSPREIQAVVNAIDREDGQCDGKFQGPLPSGHQ